MTTPQRDAAFEALLAYVRDRRGFDFTAYKRPTLLRRFRKRMEAVDTPTFEEYQRYLESHDGEFGQLFDMILINVTSFFRDAGVWEHLDKEVIPRILEGKSHGEPIRVWSAGCASGEEAYSIAMLFAEALGDEAFRERVKVYATDIDEDALARARHARYSSQQVAEIEPERRERYFQMSNNHYTFRPDARRAVIFGRNDLLQDPPISRVDLLVSRNTLMYFDRDAQERVLSNFAFALQPRGFLMLGKAEALQRREGLFTPFDLKRRIFVKERVSTRVPGQRGPVRELPEAEEQRGLRETAFEHAALAQLVVQSNGWLSAVNQAARSLLGIKPSDIGQPLQDLQVSYRPVELRSLIDQAHTDQRPATTRDVAWAPDDAAPRNLDVHVAPVFGDEGAFVGTVISFVDTTRHRALNAELERARSDLETTYEELQSTVEELETTNEELQSTNEELETMNEELHSTNEELETMNDELRERTDEALRANAFFGSILSSFRQSVIVVDRNFAVSAWSDAAGDTWGLREDEVRGQNFLGLDIGIPTGELRDPIRAVLGGDDTPDLLLTGHDRRGRRVVCTAAFAQLHGPTGDVQGAIVVMTVEPTDG